LREKSIKIGWSACARRSRRGKEDCADKKIVGLKKKVRLRIMRRSEGEWDERIKVPEKKGKREIVRRPGGDTEEGSCGGAYLLGLGG